MKFLKNIFYFILNKVRYEYYLVFEDGSKLKITMVKNVPNTYYINKEYYGVVNVTDEIINKNLIRRWIKIEKIY